MKTMKIGDKVRIKTTISSQEVILNGTISCILKNSAFSYRVILDSYPSVNMPVLETEVQLIERKLKRHPLTDIFV
jgi:hypothetical protein